MRNETLRGLGVLVLLLSGLGAGCGMSSLDPSLPFYTSDQVDSDHPGYRRTTISTKDAVYVNDFEEASLQLSNPDPTELVGRRGLGGEICAIQGQDPAVYLAVDMGSEMPAFAVFRNVKHPPFDWRHAAFQKMRLDVPDGPTNNKETTDAALIDEVVGTLREGTPASPPVTAPPMPITGLNSRVHGVLLFSDQLPGLVFRPTFYLAESGRAYLVENVVVHYTRTEQTFEAAWNPAGPLFTLWVQTPSSSTPPASPASR